MTDKPRSTRSARRAWIYQPPQAPPWRDLFTGGDKRKAFLRYWVRGGLINALDLTIFYGMKLMPASTCSNLGARLGRYAIPRWYRPGIARTRTNLKRLLSGMPEADRDALMRRNWENQGRLMTEFSVVNRMAVDRNRVNLDGIEQLSETARAGPVILMPMHTGNWELIASIVSRAGLDVAIAYAPPKGAAKQWITRRVRETAGVTLLPPGKETIRPAIKWLKAGRAVSIFCDEGLHGKIRGPFLGRPLHLDGNLAVVARLARLTGATICPVHTVRHAGSKFHFHALTPIRLAEGASLEEDVQRLNDVIEPVIRAHLDQWYFIDNAL